MNLQEYIYIYIIHLIIGISYESREKKIKKPDHFLRKYSLSLWLMKIHIKSFFYTMQWLIVHQEKRISKKKKKEKIFFFFLFNYFI